MTLASIAQHASGALPGWITETNLLNVFIVYVTALFVFSLVLRAWFYRSVYIIAMHVKQKCPNVVELLEKHWGWCVRDGVVVRTALYVVVFVPYWILARLVFPFGVVSISKLEELHPLLLVGTLVLWGLMMGIDLFLVLQVSAVDSRRIIKDLSDAEYWLGGNLNRLMMRLGKWNPIGRFADAVALQQMQWFNGVFRTSMSLMIVQVLLRLGVGACLFSAIYVQGY